MTCSGITVVCFLLFSCKENDNDNNNIEHNNK